MSKLKTRHEASIFFDYVIVGRFKNDEKIFVNEDFLRNITCMKSGEGIQFSSHCVTQIPQRTSVSTRRSAIKEYTVISLK